MGRKRLRKRNNGLSSFKGKKILTATAGKTYLLLYLDLRSSSVEAPLSIGDNSSGHGHEKSPLAAFPSMGRVAAGQTMEKRPQPTEEPAEASILAEGSLNDNKNGLLI
jgi:hypothetical protein